MQFQESWSQEVNETRSQRVSKVILEMSQVYPIITETVRVDRKRVYDNDQKSKKKTDTVTFVLLDVAQL